jgi:plasmid stabilization system protein ParE
MMFRVTILPQARDDIDRNADWWADHYSVEQALRWSDAIYDQLATLRTFPESHSLAAENDEFRYEIREKLVGLGSRPGYRAIFTIKDDEVFVLTVRAAEQDRLTTHDVTFEVDPE